MTPRPDDSLIEQRVQHERDWAYALWLDRLTFRQIRRVANMAPSEGGLGYDLGEQAIKGLVLAARESIGDVTMSRDERIERQAAEIDARARTARLEFEALANKAQSLDTAIAELRESNARYDDPLTYVNRLAKLVDQRGRVAAELERADLRLDRAQVAERKLFGLDAPSEAKLEITTRDAVTDELNEMLERAGHKPVAVPR